MRLALALWLAVPTLAGGEERRLAVVPVRVLAFNQKPIACVSADLRGAEPFDAGGPLIEKGRACRGEWYSRFGDFVQAQAEPLREGEVEQFKASLIKEELVSPPLRKNESVQEWPVEANRGKAGQELVKGVQSGEVALPLEKTEKSVPQPALNRPSFAIMADLSAPVSEAPSPSSEDLSALEPPATEALGAEIPEQAKEPPDSLEKRP